MRYGVVMRTDIELSLIAELAVEAEAAGWDGYFVWDSFAGQDPWVLLTTVAVRTERLRIGPLLTPPSRRRPWQLASETATLDHLSGGRLVLPLGLGAPEDLGFARFSEVVDRRTRAALLDESIDILQALWGGGPVDYAGEHYRLQSASFQLTPLQSPRIPIWVVGVWGSERSMRRVLRCDGILPVKKTSNGISYTLTPDDIRAIKAYVDEELNGSRAFDIVLEGETPGDDAASAASVVLPLAEAGATWWIEDVASTPYRAGGIEGMRTRIRQGPPRS